MTRGVPADRRIFAPLVAQGAELVELALTYKRPTAEARQLVGRLLAGGFSDLLLTSAQGVRALGRGLEGAGLDARALEGVTIWAIGRVTARSLSERLGLEAAWVPTEFSGEGLVALAERVGVAGRRFLFPTARGARRRAPEGLTALGAEIDEIACYETLPDPEARARLARALRGGLSLVAVASPSAARALAGALDQLGVDRRRLALAAIGPVTAEAGEALGFVVPIVPESYTLPDLVAAIVARGARGTGFGRRGDEEG